VGRAKRAAQVAGFRRTGNQVDALAPVPKGSETAGGQILFVRRGCGVNAACRPPRQRTECMVLPEDPGQDSSEQDFDQVNNA
jgi:hypothetical protein